MSDSQQNGGGLWLAGKRLLVAEDEFLIALDIESILEGAGAEVKTANRVDQALALIERDGPFDAAVLDLKLERETSVAIAERLQAQSVPFVFLTGAAGDASAVAQFANAPVVGKPFDSETLFSALKQAMKAHR
jgi:two-component system, response regulator PdtaR